MDEKKKVPWYQFRDGEFMTNERIQRHKELKLLHPNKRVGLFQLWDKEETIEVLKVALVSFIVSLVTSAILILTKVLRGL